MTSQFDSFLNGIKDKVFNQSSKITHSTNRIDEFERFAKTMNVYAKILKNNIHRKLIIQLLELGFFYNRQVTREFNLTTTNHVKEIIDRFLDFDIIRKKELEDHEKAFLKSAYKLDNHKVNQVVAYELTPEARTFFVCMQEDILNILNAEAKKESSFVRELKKKKEQLHKSKTQTTKEKETTIKEVVANSPILNKLAVIRKYEELGIKTIYEYKNTYKNYYQFFKLGKIKFKNRYWLPKETVIELNLILKDYFREKPQKSKPQKKKGNLRLGFKPGDTEEINLNGRGK